MYNLCFCLSKLYTNIQQDQKAKLDYHLSLLFAYMAGGEGVGGSEGLKCFVTGGQNFFLLAFCACVCRGGRFSTSPSVKKKITDPLLLINDGPYNKKSQGSLRRLSFFKILLGRIIDRSMRYCTQE